MTHFLDRIDDSSDDGCWPWTGPLDRDGYPVAKIGGRQRRVHRVIYEEFVGPIPAGHTIDHECHNRDPNCHGGPCPHRACCRFGHLVVRTLVDNQHSSPWTNASRTTCREGHPLDQVHGGRRRCGECRARQSREYRARRKAAA